MFNKHKHDQLKATEDLRIKTIKVEEIRNKSRWHKKLAKRNRFPTIAGNIINDERIERCVRLASLDELVYSVHVSFAGFAADYRKNEADNSGREAATNAGNNEGTSMCGEYRMANLGLGVCQVETGFTDANNRSNSSTIRTYAAEYSLGGGANLAVVYFTDEHEANSVTNTDALCSNTNLRFNFLSEAEFIAGIKISPVGITVTAIKKIKRNTSKFSKNKSLSSFNSSSYFG